MAKERNFNPVQAQRKADKAKAIKKGTFSGSNKTFILAHSLTALYAGKAQVQISRNERLAKRNPARIQQQIDELHAITKDGGKLSAHEEQVLKGLEAEIKAVTKAREALGDKAPTFGRGGGGGPRDGERGVLGKRRRGADDDSSSDSDIPDDVKNIPMPRDTPPPIPKEIMDQWYAKRRARRANANLEPLGERDGRPRGSASGEDGAGLPPKPETVVETKTVYEAKPVIRNLQKEAVSAFVPAAVRAKIEKGKGQGGLLEPEEADQLEREGYLRPARHGSDASPPADEQAGESAAGLHAVTMEEVEDEDG